MTWKVVASVQQTVNNWSSVVRIPVFHLDCSLIELNSLIRRTVDPFGLFHVYFGAYSDTGVYLTEKDFK